MAVKDKVVIKERIPELRNNLESIAQKIRDHIGSRGAAHVVGTTEHPGFMDKDLYNKLLGFKSQIADLRKRAEEAVLPEGSMLYWSKSETEIPEGFVLCNGSNDTLDMRGKFVMEAKSDSEYTEVSGRDSVDITEFPVPRHTHSFNNYVFSEIWKEINWYSGVQLKYYDNKLGSDSSWADTVWPSAYYDSTVTTVIPSYTGDQKSVDIVPPYKSLAVIKKTSQIAPEVADGVGTIHIVLSKNIPEGLLELNGSLISKTLYRGLYQYAMSANLVISESAWTSYKNKYGSVPYFGESSTAGMLRLPVIQNSCMAVNEPYGKLSTTERKVSKHFHAIGSLSNNNGRWGWFDYSNATYPTGSTGIGWNGSNGGVGPGSGDPPTTGHCITSENIDIGNPGNGKVCDTNNLTFAIRAYHPEYVTVDDEAENTVVALSAMTTKAAATISSDPDSIGDNWVENADGTLSVWGSQGVSETIVLPRAMKTRILNVKLRNTNPDSDQPTLKSFTPESIVVNLGDHLSTDTITYYITGC